MLHTNRSANGTVQSVDVGSIAAPHRRRHSSATNFATRTLRFRPAKGVLVAFIAACTLIAMLAIGLSLLG
jgi:hypothetical protein